MKTLALLLILGITTARAQTCTVHEWGTFTTVSGSDGTLLPGLQREEEGLPPFVESHEGMENWGNTPSNADGHFSVGKGWLRPLKNVTVKMETPVIYFYTDQEFQAHVEVDFHGGSISQWYPSRSGGETPPGETANAVANAFRIGGAGVSHLLGDIDFAQKYEGSIHWDIAVTPPAESDGSRIFRGSETPNWLFPRQTDSALVTAKNGTADKFLFYRGVGNFELPVVFKMEKDRVLTIQNRGETAIPRLFIYELDDGMSARFQLLDALPAGQATSIDLEKLTATGQWQKPVYNTLAEALRDAGLYRKEADAMLQTWWQSYFQKPGLRVFWIVPGAFTESILPLRIQPAPKTITRVLVGRAEILTPEFERNLVKQKSDPNLYFWKNDRYLDAYVERVRQLTGK
ncbi:MAG: hypothetical protein ABIT76_08475 [Chthoniobacterales bacterium]